jgi:ribosomal protein S18 acetylase RimI-like enzyme
MHVVTRAIRRLPNALGIDETGRVRGVLGRAFADDPVWTWLVRGRRSEERAGAVLAHLVRSQVGRGGELWAGADLEAVAAWVPPHTPPVREVDYLRQLPRVLVPLGAGGLRRLLPLAETDRHHPKEPHWYLAVLGTDPAHQGRGFGGALIEPFIERADEGGVGCYLESSKESNVAFYRRFGFEVTDVLHIDRGRGPDLFLMWRDPR